VGAGNPAQNHANIFTQTLSDAGHQHRADHEQGVRAGPDLLESSFTLPLFQLVVSQFTDQFLPELLGMTMMFEWESVELATTARLLEHFGLDSTYYRLHVAIDNADVGHGAIAKRAVKRYLPGSRRGRTPAAVAAHLERLRRRSGSPATLGQDLVDKLLAPSRKRDQVIAMIENKKRYGSLNHGGAGDRMNNNLFDNPPNCSTCCAPAGR
jgi:hypothetical protein